LCGVSGWADDLVNRMQTELAGLQRQALNRPLRRVYVEEWPKPLINGAPWIAEIVELLGGAFVPSPAGRTVEEAEVIAADPELIVLNWAGIDKIEPARVLKRTGWEKVSAVRSGRVVAVNEILLNAPGPNLVEGAQQLWQIMDGAECDS
jgi:iron complex transport system substrate-binding protein